MAAVRLADVKRTLRQGEPAARGIKKVPKFLTRFLDTSSQRGSVGSGAKEPLSRERERLEAILEQRIWPRLQMIAADFNKMYGRHAIPVGEIATSPDSEAPASALAASAFATSLHARPGIGGARVGTELISHPEIKSLVENDFLRQQEDGKQWGVYGHRFVFDGSILPHTNLYPIQVNNHTPYSDGHCRGQDEYEHVTPSRPTPRRP